MLNGEIQPQDFPRFSCSKKSRFQFTMKRVLTQREIPIHKVNDLASLYTDSLVDRLHNRRFLHSDSISKINVQYIIHFRTRKPFFLTVNEHRRISANFILLRLRFCISHLQFCEFLQMPDSPVWSRHGLPSESKRRRLSTIIYRVILNIVERMTVILKIKLRKNWLVSAIWFNRFMTLYKDDNEIYFVNALKWTAFFWIVSNITPGLYQTQIFKYFKSMNRQTEWCYNIIISRE